MLTGTQGCAPWDAGYPSDGLNQTVIGISDVACKQNRGYNGV